MNRETTFDIRSVENAIGPRPTLPVLKRDGFELCDTSFTVGGYKRETGGRLAQLFNPEIKKTSEQKARKDAKKLFKKDFFAAQLRHYDVKFKASGKVAELRGLLEGSVQQGKCNRTPESTVRLQREMFSDYQHLRQNWHAEVAAWEEKRKLWEAEQLELQRQAQEERWNRCDARSRAILDFVRFVRHYFVSDDGTPDPTKTPDVVVINMNRYNVQLIQRHVPGLYVAPCENLWVRQEDAVIGWDCNEVFRVAQERTMTAIEKRKREDEERKCEDEERAQLKWQKAKDEWERSVQPHQQYMAQRAAMEPPQTFELQHCVGSYVVRLDKLTSEYDDSGESLYLHISPGVDGTLVANQSFASLVGTVLLSTAEDKLEELAVGLADNSDDDGEEAAWDVRVGDARDFDERVKAIKAKRKAAAFEAGQAKRQEIASRQPVPRRVYFRMRGMCGDDDSYQTEEGHLDFLDNSCITFEGRFYNHELLGRNVDFTGYRISDRPLEEPAPWSQWSECRHDGYRY